MSRTRVAVTIPQRFNNGRRIPSTLRAQIEEELLALGGGFTALHVRGAWRDSAGRVYRDVSTRYEISGVTLSQVLARARRWATPLRQAMLFVESASTRTAFARPTVAAK